MHAKGFLSGNFCGQVAVGEIDVRLGAADKQPAAVRCRLPPPHSLVVVGLEAGLAVRSGQQSIWNRGSIIAKELGSRNKGDGRVRELSVEPIEDGRRYASGCPA